MKVLDRAFDACIDVGEWERAVRHGTELSDLSRYSILASLIKCYIYTVSQKRMALLWFAITTTNIERF